MPFEKMYVCIKCKYTTTDKTEADNHKASCGSEYMTLGTFGRVVRW